MNSNERMVRKQVYVTPEQDRILSARASQLGCTQSEVIRMAIELVGAQRDLETRRSTLDEVFGLWQGRTEPDFDQIRRESDDRA